MEQLALERPYVLFEQTMVEVKYAVLGERSAFSIPFQGWSVLVLYVS
jgi:hypothetical protein